MPNRFFITGTDTGVGKTVVSALLCAGLHAIYWKPIQTGTRDGADTRTVMRLAQLPRDRTLPEVYRFAPPVSPHLAARRAGVRIELRKIRLPRIATRESVIVEGAGGVLVPINARQLMVDLMRQLKLPVLASFADFARHDQSHVAVSGRAARRKNRGQGCGPGWQAEPRKTAKRSNIMVRWMSSDGFRGSASSTARRCCRCFTKSLTPEPLPYEF